MSFQTFTAASIAEAKQSMRDALGPGAVILATRKRPDGTVELRAIKKGQPLFEGEGGSSLGSRLGGKSSLSSRGMAARQKNKAPMAIDKSHREGAGLHGKIEKSATEMALNHLKGDFAQKLSRDNYNNDPIYRDYAQRLGRHGIIPALVKALAIEAHNADVTSETGRLAFAMGRVLSFSPITLSPDQPIMLVGQTGAGKTSCAAKLAAKAAGQEKKVAFMSADLGRAGAMDQMRTYADALDTRFWPVEDPQDVERIMREERPQEIIILDTPGVSPFAPADIAAIRTFRESLGGEAVFVLPASGDPDEHIDWARAFRDIGVRRCMITKFDASRRVGAALSAAFEGNLALAHFSEAPFIADGLIDANPRYIAQRLLLDEPARIAGADV